MKLIFLTISLIACTLLANAQSKNRYKEKGIASFYADYFQGRQTASGDYYSHNKFTAAHRKLPFGTWVKVTNLDNNRSVIVRINDRGPFIDGRIIDLSKSAAKQIGDLRQGLFKVRIKVYRKKIPARIMDSDLHQK